MATKEIFDLETLHLEKGAHAKASHQMCVMEAVAYMAGEKWSDSPECASPVIAAFLRSYNDSVDDETRQSLKQYIPRLIGTRGSAALEEKRSLIAADWLVRVHASAWLRLAGLTAEADTLSSLPEITSLASVPSIKPVIGVSRKNAAAAGDAAWDAAGDAAWDAAGDAAGDAARVAARVAAGDAAWDAAGDAAGDAARDAAWDAAGDAAGDAARVAARVAAWAAAGDAAWDAAGDAARDAARVAAWAAAGDAAWDAAGDAAWDAARVAAWDAAGDAAWDAARVAAWDAARAAAGDAAWDAARVAARVAAWAAATKKLQPTINEIRATVPELIERLLSAKKEVAND